MTWVERNLPNNDAQRRAAWAWVEKHTGDPTLIEFAARLIRLHNVDARDDVKLAEVVQKFAQQKIKYFKERPERWQSPVRTISWGIGDCDDKAFLVACMLRGFRIPVRLKFLRMVMPAGMPVREPGGTEHRIGRPRRVSHVYPQALLRGKWVTLESVREYPLGFDPEVLAQRKGIPFTAEYIGDNTP